jgi:two-component sensor histidine kinase
VVDGALSLEIHDDGAGMPAARDPRPSFMGLKLVELLARQIGAETRFESDHGTRFRLVLPLELLHESKLAAGRPDMRWSGADA